MAEETIIHDGLTAKDYEFAIFTQSACNLSGLVNGFARVMARINAEAHWQGHGTDWLNNHPICCLYAEQIAHLTRGKDYSEAYAECEERSKK